MGSINSKANINSEAKYTIIKLQWGKKFNFNFSWDGCDAQEK